jgi:hypothetical protein
MLVEGNLMELFWGHQIGEKYIKSSNSLTAHCLEGLNKSLNRGKELKVWLS